jgi:hypothetical protein
LYGWNGRVASALHETLAHCEIAFRNQIDSVLQSRHEYKNREGDWLDDRHKEFTPRASALLSDARELARNKARRMSKQSAHPDSWERGSVIAELNLGFWLRLLDARYENVHGTAVMRNFASLKQPQIQKMGHLRHLVEPLYALRNRIAHHEPIWAINHRARRDDALTLIGFSSAELRGWVSERCWLEGLGRRPNVIEI